jgi:hypothetical protein
LVPLENELMGKLERREQNTPFGIGDALKTMKNRIT